MFAVYVYCITDWNVSLWDVQQEGIVTKNACSGRPWNGFITKPKIYLEYMMEQVRTHKNEQYAILMDSDTMFSGLTSVSQIWNKYDCARHDKDILMSTETSCWLGQYCTPTNISKYYPPEFIQQVPSYSPFANSGVIMGSMKALIAMLQYVILHNTSYYLHAPHQNYRYKFDDQFAYADYCLKVNTSVCMLDYHQSIAASISLTFQDVLDSVTRSWPFVCKTLNNSLSYHCPDVTWNIFKAGYLYLDGNNCGIVRQWSANDKSQGKSNYMHQEQLLSLDPNPLIYHGNGAGKPILLHKNGLGAKSFECLLLLKRGFNSTVYYDTKTFQRDYHSNNESPSK